MAIIDGPTFGIETITLTAICQTHEWHAHHFGHWMRPTAGRGRVELCNEVPINVQVGDRVYVPGGQVHRAKALTETFTFVCELPHRDDEGHPVPSYSGNDRAYT